MGIPWIYIYIRWETSAKFQLILDHEAVEVFNGVSLSSESTDNTLFNPLGSPSWSLPSDPVPALLFPDAFEKFAAATFPPPPPPSLHPKARDKIL